MFSAIATGFMQKFAGSFRMPFVYLHLAAIAITIVLVMSGADWAFFQATRAVTFEWLVFGAGIGGFFVPLLVPIGLYVWGERMRLHRLSLAAITLLQVSAVAWLVSSTYKAFTGRLQPEFLTTFGTVDISHAFNFGFWENGIFWGWPSSHTCVAVAGSVAFARIFPDRPSLGYLAYAYAAFVAAGAAVGFHWLSDVFAGALIGYAIAASSTPSAVERS